MENLMSAPENKREFREKLVSKLASWKLENTTGEINFGKVFESELAAIAKNIYESKEEEIKKIKIAMMMLENEDYIKQPKEILDLCESTFLNLEKRYGYTKKNSWQSLVFLNG